jgi:hypothetical protein
MSIDSEIQDDPRPNRHERRRRAALGRKSGVNIERDDRVYPLEVIADAAGFSVPTLRRLAAKRKIIITHVSDRRVGVRGRHYHEYLDQCPVS